MNEFKRDKANKEWLDVMEHQGENCNGSDEQQTISKDEPEKKLKLQCSNCTISSEEQVAGKTSHGTKSNNGNNNSNGSSDKSNDNGHNWNDNKLVACLPHDEDDNEYVWRRGMNTNTRLPACLAARFFVPSASQPLLT